MVPISHVVSYDGQITGLNWPSPTCTKKRSCTSYPSYSTILWFYTSMICLTGYSLDWGGFRAEGQNFSVIPNFFETSHLWIYCIYSFNKVLVGIALGVFSCSHSLPQEPETGAAEIKFILASIPELESGWARKGSSSSVELATPFNQLTLHLRHLSRGYCTFVAKLNQSHMLTTAMLVGLLGKCTLPLPLCTPLLWGC